jgi:hypothetical protein
LYHGGRASPATFSPPAPQKPFDARAVERYRKPHISVRSGTPNGQE